ncbi:MAG: Crp/Fnr family transcriptional regulator [Hyphomicrobiaceae bacterium]
MDDGNAEIRGGPDQRKKRIGDAFFYKLRTFVEISAAQIDCVQSLCHRETTLNPGSSVVRMGEPQDTVYVLNEGWAARYRVLNDGSRQVANFILPGDFMSLNACIFPVSDYSISAITPIRIAHFTTAGIIHMTQLHPLLCAAMFWCNAREEAMLIEHLTNVGRRNAQQRVAHLLLELARRLELSGQSVSGSHPDSLCFDMPLTQELIGDALGLTNIHVNRTMRALEEDGLIKCGRQSGIRRVVIKNPVGLSELSGFTDDYLHFAEIPQSTRRLLDTAERTRKTFAGE